MIDLCKPRQRASLLVSLFWVYVQFRAKSQGNLWSETWPRYINEQDSDLMGQSDPVQRCSSPWTSSFEPCKISLQLRMVSTEQKKGCFRDTIIACPTDNPVLRMQPLKAFDASATIKFFKNYLIQFLCGHSWWGWSKSAPWWAGPVCFLLW